MILNSGFKELRVSSRSQGSTLPKTGLPRATAFRFGQSHFEAVFNFYFNSRRDQKRARQIHALERVAILFLGLRHDAFCLMAQALAVYHYGYYTLKDRLVQFHEPKHVPSDAEAVLEWKLNTPFNSQDKPSLAIAMVVTVNGVRSLKRYRLVIAQKSKLRLTQEVIAALASHSRDYRLTASSSNKTQLCFTCVMYVKSFVFRAGRKVPHCQKRDCHAPPLFALDRAISRLFSISI